VGKDNADFHVPKSISGTADLPGGNVMITLGLWENSVGTPYVQASTTLHELGHNLDLTHGGLPATLGKKVGTTGGTESYFEPNCKPNYLSSMSYLYQVHGLYKNDGVAYLDYSNVANGAVNATPPSINETSLVDGPLGMGLNTPIYRAAWFVPYPSALATSQAVSSAGKFCSGAKFNPAPAPQPSMARVEADTVDASIDWNGDLDPANGAVNQNVNFDAKFLNGITGAQIISDSDPNRLLFGFNDWASIRLNQISAGRGTGRFSAYEGSTFEGSTFEGSTFEGSTFEGSTFEGSTFEGSTFEGSTFEGSTFEGSTFEGSTFEGSTFEGSTFEGSTFEGQELDSASARKLGRAAPHGLTACVIGTAGCTSASPLDPLYHRVHVTWNAPTFGHVFGYHVYRKTGTTTVEITPPASGTTNTSFDDTEELPDGVTFTYYAIAEFDDGTPQFSGKSNSSSIVAKNDAPAANADSGAAYTTRKGTPLNVTAPGVLANDTDGDSPTAFRARRAFLVTGPLHGTVKCGTQAAPSMCANGSFTYTPANGYDGPDSITYKSDDGLWGATSVPLSALSGNAIVSIVVTKK
jgi:hypothetical protein